MDNRIHEETPDRREDVYVRESGAERHERRVVVDRAAEQRHMASLISQFIWLAFGILEGLILIRIVLRLIAANPAVPFASFIYRITDIFLWPFAGLTVEPSVGGMVLELSSIIALLVYSLLAWVLVKLVWLLLDRVPSRVVQTYDRDVDPYDQNDIH